VAKGTFLSTDPIATGEDTAATKYNAGDTVASDIDLSALSAIGAALGAASLSTVANARNASGLLTLSITQAATDRAILGAMQSRLNFTNEQLTVTKENLSAAVSRISDVDVAEEATNYARYQILVASGTEMLKQANQLPQSALQLLR
jgi:flagellin